MGPINPNKRRQKALPLIRDRQGSLCKTPATVMNRWIEFFADMEGGTEMSIAEHEEHWRRNLQHFSATDFDVTMDMLPSLTDLEIACRRVACGKATGPDGLPGELLHHHPTKIARWLYTQMLKLTLHGHEALEHKIGFLTMAWKKKGDQSVCSSYRSLLVSSHAGKVIHRALRSHQSTLYESYLQNEQLGGRRKIPVTLCLHVARSFLRKCCLDRQCAGMIFLDLQEAFYRVVRPLVAATHMDDPMIAQMARRLQMDDNALHELYALLREPTAVEQAGLNQIQQRYVAALHTDTGFRLKGQHSTIRTQIGSRPGDCFADVIFGYAWARLLKSFESDLQQQGLLESIDVVETWQPFNCSRVVGQREFLGPTWMDDLCVCLRAPNAHQLERKVAVTVGLLIDKCRGYAMSPNLSKGKSEVMMSLRGPGSKAVKAKYFGGQSSGKMRILGEEQSYDIAVVGEYLHLGNIVHHSGQGGVEVRRRVAIGHQSLAQHRRLLYHNISIPLPRRIEIFDTLVMTKVLYGAETWVLVERKNYDYFHKNLIKLYRRVLRLPHDGHFTDAEILARGPFLSPDEILCRHRLRYLVTLYQSGDNTPWGLFVDDVHWCEQIQDDLRWLYNQLKDTSSLTEPSVNFAPWRVILQHHPGYWKRLVRRGCQHAMQQRQLTQQVRDFHHEAFSILQQSGTLAYEPPKTRAKHTMSYFGCLHCQMRCRSYAGERVHMCKAHGQLAEHRYLFDGTQCPHCKKEYHTHGRLSQHLRHSHHCADALRGAGLLCEPVPGHGSLINAGQERIHNGTHIPQQGAGPDLPSAPPREKRDYNDSFYAFIAERLLDTEQHHLAECLCDAAREHVLAWTCFTATLRAFLSNYTLDDAEACQLDAEQLRRVFVQISDPLHWPMFQQDVSCECGPFALEDYENWAHHLCAKETSPWTCSEDIPRAFTRERIFLHFFSGRRRAGDIQFFLEKMQQSSTILHVISLDIIIDERLGDLSQASTRRYWLRAMSSRWVVGMLAGFQCLSLRELRDVCMGNLLLGFSLLSMLQLSIVGGTGVLEHPAEPSDDELPSIWKLSLVHFMLRLPGFAKLRVLQGLFGSQSPKPTDLMTLNLPTLCHELHSWRLTTEPPRTTSIGCQADGQFATAKLKEYPPSFCAGMATAFLHVIESMPCSDLLKSAEFEEFLDECKGMIRTEFGHHLGKDFAKPQ